MQLRRCTLRGPLPLAMLMFVLPLVYAHEALPGRISTELEAREHVSKLHQAHSDGKSFFGIDLEDVSALISTPVFTQSLREHLISELAMSNASTQCIQDVMQVLTDVAVKRQYSYQVIDAMGKPPSGILQGNVVWIGSYDQCRSILEYNNETTGDVRFKGRYFMVGMSPAFLPKQYAFVHVAWGLCAPNTCEAEGITEVVHMGLVFILGKLKVDPAMISAIVNATGVAYPQSAPWVTGDYVAIFLTSILVFLALVGTSYDIVKRVQKALSNPFDKVYITDGNINTPSEDADSDLIGNAVPPHGSNSSTPINPSPKRMESVKGFFHAVLMSFSFITNGEKLLNTEIREGTLAAVNGIRVISMWWVILGHTYVFTVASFATNTLTLLDVLKRFSFQAISNATYSVDSFFFLSGLLVTFLLLRELRSNSGKTNWFMLYIHRFWRLTPTYMFVIMIYTTLSLHMPEGPYMRQMDTGAQACYKYWWTNLLYINNLIPSGLGDECMGWSWYLANDMQFFIISPLVIYLLYRFRYAGYGLITALLLACLISTGVVARLNNVNPNILAGGNTAIGGDIYIRPWYRIAPYLVGMVCGYAISAWNNNGRPRLYKSGVIIGWCAAIAVNMSIIYGLYGPVHTGVSWNDDVNALYVATSRFAWALGLGWVTFACVTGYGGPINTFLSWGAWAPLGRLTYCAYLVHPIVIFNYLLSRRGPMYYTDYTMIYFYIGHLVIAYLLAFVVSLLVEAPLMGLEKIIFKRKKD